MKLRLLSVNFVFATVLLVASPLLRAQDGAEGALAQASHTILLGQHWNTLAGPTLAIADFDGDNKQDGAVVLESAPFLPFGNFQIDLHFSDRDNASIIFQSSESDLAVGALDIDHDGDIDIVIEQSVTHKRLQVWINDGHGDFAKGHIEDFPSVVTPTRDQVMSLERWDFSAVSLPSQRGFETMLMSCHVAGRPPSDGGIALVQTPSFQADRTLSLASSRAPPLT